MLRTAQLTCQRAGWLRARLRGYLGESIIMRAENSITAPSRATLAGHRPMPCYGAGQCKRDHRPSSACGSSPGHPNSCRVNVYTMHQASTRQASQGVPPRRELVCLRSQASPPSRQCSCSCTRIVSQAALACRAFGFALSGRELSRCGHSGRLVGQPSSKPCPPCR